MKRGKQVKRTKIIFVANRLGGGGAERVLTLIANSLSKDYNVCILYYNSCANEYDIECSTKQICDEKIKSNFKRILALRKVLKREKADVVISFEYFINIRAIVASLGLKHKLIVSERNDPNKLNSRKFAKVLRDILYNFSDALVCQTPDAKEYFSEKIQGKSFVVPNPIKGGLPLWKYDNSRNEIINFCRLEKQKNIPLLIDAFNDFSHEFSNYTLHIYGEGKEQENIEQYINNKRLAEKVKIHKFSENIHKIASECRMFVLSSDYEGLSNSMLEAMSMGMPVICTDCPIGGAKMVIKNYENGILVPCNDRKAMSEAMSKIATNREFSENLSKNALHIREDLSLKNILDIWINILNRLLDK